MAALESLPKGIAFFTFLFLFSFSLSLFFFLFFFFFFFLFCLLSILLSFSNTVFTLSFFSLFCFLVSLTSLHLLTLYQEKLSCQCSQCFEIQRSWCCLFHLYHIENSLICTLKHCCNKILLSLYITWIPADILFCYYGFQQLNIN